jgi:hypothetical protein
MPSALGEQAGRFDERNLFLMLALGLLSFGERLDVLLREHAPEPAAPERAALEHDPFAHLLLGAISLRATLRRELRAAALDPSDVEPLETTAAAGEQETARRQARGRAPSRSLLR